jgi:hypothetical protein
MAQHTTSGMHPECEAKWERRKTLLSLMDSLVESVCDQFDVRLKPQLQIDIALLIEQHIDNTQEKRYET